MKRSMYILLIDLMQGLTPTKTMHSASNHNDLQQIVLLFSIHILFYLHNMKNPFIAWVPIRSRSWHRPRGLIGGRVGAN